MKPASVKIVDAVDLVAGRAGDGDDGASAASSAAASAAASSASSASSIVATASRFEELAMDGFCRCADQCNGHWKQGKQPREQRCRSV